MTLRFKFLMVLLAAALLPIVLVVIHDARAMRLLGQDLARRSGEALTDRLTAQLRHAIESGSTIFRYQKELVEFGLLLQAREVAARLNRPPPPQEFREDIFLPATFDSREGHRPPGLKPSPRHRRKGPDGAVSFMEVSYETPVFHLPPGVEREAVAEDMARLSTLGPAFRGLSADHEDIFYWQFVTLESGLHVSYPGHGGYPDGFDPRQRPWYRHALASGGLTWNHPVFDASSRRLAVTASVPVVKADGKVAGVTAIGLDAQGLLDGLREKASLPAGARFLLVDLARHSGEGEGLRVVIRGIEQEADWQAVPRSEWLDSTDQETLAALKADIAAGRNGVRRLPLAGEDTLWAHAPVDNFNTALLILMPVRDIVGQAADAEAAVRDAARRQIAIAGIFAFVVIGIVVVLSFAGARAVTRPLRSLDGAARRLAEGDLEARAEVVGRDELGRLAETFNAMAPRLKDHLRLSQSLALASEVQERLLPAGPPTLGGFDIAGASLSCDETSGDYFDFIPLPGDRLGVAVGDVTGHGVPAALLMATARGLLRARADRAPSLADLMAGVNRQLAQDALAGRFMTLAYLELKAGSRDVVWANAGHEPVLAWNPNDGAFAELAGDDPPLGIDGETTFHEFRAPGLPPGTILVLATDGVTELRGPDGAMFGRERLKETIEAHAHGTSADLLTAVKRKAIAHAHGTPIRDDATLVVVKVL